MKKKYGYLCFAAITSVMLAGCGPKENYDCNNKQAKKAFEAAVEDMIITDMIRSRGFTFANKKVFDEADNDKMKEIYAEIKAEYSKISIDIQSINTKNKSETLKKSECEAKISINGMEPRVVPYTIKALSDEKVEANITTRQ